MNSSTRFNSIEERMRITFLSLILLFGFSILLQAQMPDTITVLTKRIKGYGPFYSAYSRMISPIAAKDTSNPWIKIMPDIRKIPQKLEGLMFTTIFVDIQQQLYQSYYAGKVDDEFYNSVKLGWGWEPDSNDYTKESVKACIAVAAGYDKNDYLLVAVDRNNNYDLSDDGYYIVPKEDPDLSYNERFDELLPFEVSYEYYNGSHIIKDSIWIHIDYWPNQKNNLPIKLAFNLAEHRIGKFSVENKTYNLALYRRRPTSNEFYIVKIWDKDSIQNPDNLKFFGLGEKVKVNNTDYAIVKFSKTGEYVKLVKKMSIDLTEGNYRGAIAYNITETSVSGEPFNLSALRGNYVLLDFWGTWCVPCRKEMPMLKELHESYKDKNFVMVGIAKDELNDLNRFLKEEDINWTQLLQEDDISILKLYNINQYPTTFLIDPSGIIIEKNLRGEQLKQRIKSLFN